MGSKLSKKEFISRYAKRIRLLLGLDIETARDFADTAYEDYDALDSPEEMAQEEAELWID